MKNCYFFKIVVIFITIVLLTSTVYSKKKVSLDGMKIPVVAIVIDRHIDPGAFPELADTLNYYATQGDFGFDKLATHTQGKIFGDLKECLKFELIPEEDVINTPVYKELRKDLKIGTNPMQIPEGYIAITSGERKNITKIIENIAPGNAVMLVDVIFALTKKASLSDIVKTGKVMADATVSLSVYQIIGGKLKKVLRVMEVGISESTFQIKLTKINDYREIKNLCQEAIDDAFKAVCKKLKK